MQRQIADDGPRCGRVSWQPRSGPDRRREMRVVVEARDHVPMQMGHQIAETREVDLPRRVKSAQCRLGRENQCHQVVPFRAGEIGHFAHMRAPDDPAETGIVNRLRAANPDHAT